MAVSPHGRRFLHFGGYLSPLLILWTLAQCFILFCGLTNLFQSYWKMHGKWQFVTWSGCFYELLQFIFQLGHRLLCVYLLSKGEKLNLDIIAGVLSSKAEFLWYELWRAHTWIINGCIVMQLPAVIIWGGKQCKSEGWENKHLFSEAWSLGTQLFVSFICSSLSLDMGRRSKCSKNFA